ncbi:class I SAM-dependent rRNA methyltransferase [Streptococcus cuniculipharyngis]|uniref:Class I SAM-dependent rRNA methyltransferase n=1 Tax=Streptococcus cuniculipharyngis TaxID=1562651 RepID=A0A5C5SAX9_9STRE|nr:class I SAM-dependent rRNA methyltransferase [Streptococcus cuniculipharyngis]TWS98037.1 class I SAM-dependent rRNA methyltransferase [Streptococcus cuniculipharyngis]
MKKLRITEQARKKLARGVQLLVEKDFVSTPSGQGLAELYDANHRRQGLAYLAPQNKGVGWFLSPNDLNLDQAYFEGLFRTAKRKRQAYEGSQLTTAYRLFNQDGDAFGGLTIDRYGDYALFSWYNEFVYDLRSLIVAAFKVVFPDIRGGYEKIRFCGLAYESAHLYGQEAPETFSILENGVRYQVFLNDGLMTGIFLDQHEVRASLVDGLATGKSLLNMFSYTAAFSVAAAMGGASRTVSVDLAKRSRDLSQAHFLANGLTLNHHQFLVMDVFEYFRYAIRKGLRFDLIVLDPPSFARNKKQTFSVAKDYHKLVSAALPLLNPAGILITSTNASNLSVEQFKQEVEKGMGGLAHTYLETRQLPDDFTVNLADPTSNYLKVFTIQVN